MGQRRNDKDQYLGIIHVYVSEVTWRNGGTGFREV